MWHTHATISSSPHSCRMPIKDTLLISISTSLTQFSRQCCANKKQINTSYVPRVHHMYSRHLPSPSLIIISTPYVFKVGGCQCVSVGAPHPSSLTSLFARQQQQHIKLFIQPSSRDAGGLKNCCQHNNNNEKLRRRLKSPTSVYCTSSGGKSPEQSR